MHEFGPSYKNRPPAKARLGKALPKPDNVRATLAAQELHAYHIALICSFKLWADRNGLHLKAL
jgi:hypothetical protein